LLLLLVGHLVGLTLPEIKNASDRNLRRLWCVAIYTHQP